MKRSIVIASAVVLAIIPIAIVAAPGGDSTPSPAATTIGTTSHTIEATPPPKELDAPSKAAIEPEVASGSAAKPDLIECTFVVTANATGAEVWIDKKRRGAVGASLTLPCGSATITVRHPAYLEQTRTVTLVPDGRVPFTLARRPQPQPAQVPKSVTGGRLLSPR